MTIFGDFVVDVYAPQVNRRAPPNPDPTQRGTPRRPGVGTDDQARGTTDRPIISQVAQLRAITPYLGYYTLPETNSKFAPENRPKPNRKGSYSNHPFLGAKMLVSGRVVLVVVAVVF